MRCLNEEQSRIVFKVADGFQKEIPGGRMIRVEDGNQLARANAACRY